jgi:hypothetical protein
MPRESTSSRRSGTEVGTPRRTAGLRQPEKAAEQNSVALQEGIVAEPSGHAEPPAGAETESNLPMPRFRIFIIDSGWNSPAHRVLQENFGILRELQKEDPIYVLSQEQSIEFIRHHQDRIGREPLIAVHDLAAMRDSGTEDFHGFRLHLGLLRTPEQALLALQNFVRFLSTHRHSVDLEAEIRADLRREGFAGAIEIILHHEAREIGG